MTTYSDTILFIVNGITQTSNSGDTISISRNLTIASPSSFNVGVAINFTAANTTPNITQTSTSSGSGQALTIQAQGATGASNNGGNLILSSGTSGSATVGNVQLQAGGTTIAKVDANKFYALKGFNQNVTSTTTNYNVLSTDNIIAVGTITGTITITLPASPSTGDTYVIKDTKGLSLTYPITVSGNGNSIDGFSTYTIETNYASLVLCFISTQWSVL